MSSLVTRRFSTTVGPGESGQLTADAERDATVERVDVRFYAGPRLDLRLVPFVRSDANRVELIDTTGRDAIVGDNDVFQFEVSEPLGTTDTLGVAFENVDEEHSYDFAVDLQIDREKGQDRVFGGWF